MASKLLESTPTALAHSIQPADRLQSKRMRKDLQLRFSALVLAFLTLTAVVFSGINFWKEGYFPVPTDGAWWIESGDGLVAERVAAGGPAEKAGIKPGDQLLAVNDQPIKSFRDAQGKVVANALTYLVREQYKTGIL